MNPYTEYSILFLILFSAAATVTSFLFYRKVKIPFPSKTFLIFLRAVSLLSILLLITFSFIFVNKKESRKPVNIFLVDKSKSAFLFNSPDEIKEKSEEIFKSLSNSNAENRLYGFAGDLIPNKDNSNLNSDFVISADTECTNAGKTIETLIKSPDGSRISTINMISDGMINKGGNPLFQILRGNSMFNFYLTGDTIQKKDLLVKDVYFNKTSYAGSNTEILAEINSFNFDKEIKVNLYEEGNLIQSKNLKVSKENKVYDIKFIIKSAAEGIKRYRIETEKEPDEITDRNNTEEFFIKFISNKFKALVISGNPGADYSYLKEALLSSENFEPVFFTQKSPGVFYEGTVPPLNGFSVLIMINFPNTATDLNSIERINEELKNSNTPLFFIAGSNTDYEKLKMLENHLPFQITNIKGAEEKSSLKFADEPGKSDANFSGIKNGIVNSQEIFIPGTAINQKPGVRTVLYSLKLSKPVLFYTEGGNVNSAALLGYNFFKWRLDENNKNSRDLIGNITKEIILNINNRDKDKKINITTNKQVYSGFEEIKINGNINTGTLQGSELVKVQIFNNSTNNELQVTKNNSGDFSSTARDIPEGEYIIKGTLYENGTETGSDLTKIIVKESVLEYKETVPDDRLLNELASRTGGYRIRENNQGKIKEKIAEKNKTDETIINAGEKIFLNSSFILLTVIIITLSAEWYLRKRLNLP